MTKGLSMENDRIALIGIIIEKKDNVASLNKILSDNSQYIIGRMGIPHTKRDISIISVVVEGPVEVINGISGKLGAIDGVSSKVLYSKV